MLISCQKSSLGYLVWFRQPPDRWTDTQTYTSPSHLCPKRDIGEHSFCLFSTSQTGWHGDELQVRHNCPLLFVVVVRPFTTNPHASTLLAGWFMAGKERWSGGGRYMDGCHVSYSNWAVNGRKGVAEIVTPPPHPLIANKQFLEERMSCTEATSFQWPQGGFDSSPATILHGSRCQCVDGIIKHMLKML